MATNSIKTRIINKHDIEANWNLATNFTPNKGELIIYDKGTGYDYPRLKIGDGSTKVGLLPFIDEKLTANIINITSQVNKINDKLGSFGSAATYGATTTVTSGSSNLITSGGVASYAVPRRDKGYAYNDLASHYTAGSAVIYRIIFPDVQDAIWNMVNLEVMIRQEYQRELAGKILINAHHDNNATAWSVANAVISGYLTEDIEVYTSGTKYFYIKGCNTYSTISLCKMIIGDTATGNDLSNVTIDTVTELPSDAVKATMRYTLNMDTADSRYCTLATNQTITGNKTFQGKNIFEASNNYNTTDTQKFIVGNSSSAFVFGGDGLQCFTGTNSTTAKAMYMQYYGGDLMIGSGGKVTIASGGAISTPSTITATGNITSSGDVIGNYLCTKTTAEESSASTSIAVVASNGYIRKLSMPSGANYDSGSNIWAKLVNIGVQNFSIGSSAPTDADYFISQYAGGGTSQPEFYRRPVSALWSYMNGKAASVYAKLASPNNMIYNNNEVCWVPDNYNNYIWINYRSVGGTDKSTVTGYKFGNANGSTSNVFVEANTFSLLQSANMTYNSTDKCIEFTFA